MKRHTPVIKQPKNIGKAFHSGRKFTAPLATGVKVHLVITRSTGDTEAYKLAELKDLGEAANYRRKIIAVKVPGKKAA